MTVVEEIKQKTDIVEIIGQYVQLTKSGRTMRAPCPFHSEKKPSFFVYPEQQTWHCFGACNTGGDVFSFIMKKEGIEFEDALRLLAEKTGVVIPSKARSEADEKARDKILQINQAASQYYHNLLLSNPAAEKARRYLDGRGVNEKAISDFQLGFSLPGWDSLKLYLTEKGYTENDQLEAGLIIRSEERNKTFDRFRDHIMFPITDDHGQVTGFGARTLDPNFQGPKYINSPQTRVFDKSGSLYGIQLAKTAIRQQNLAVLVEGYMDVIIAHQYGFSNVIAPMGVAVTERQINRIKKLTHSLALALDPDAAGEEAAMRCVAYENTLDAEVRVITLPPGKDPDEVIKENTQNWLAAVEKAMPVIEFTIKVISSKLNLKSTQGKTEAMNKLLPIIAEVKAGPRQYQYLTKLAVAVGIDDKRLEAALGRFKADRKARETRPQAIRAATRTIRSSPVEEYILSILLQHPEIKGKTQNLLGEYFENSENRAIFDMWQKSGGLAIAPESVDAAVLEHFNSLLNRKLPGDEVDERYSDCVLRLKERYLRNLERRKAEALALEAESGVKNADLTKLQEMGMEVSIELRNIDNIRNKPR